MKFFFTLVFVLLSTFPSGAQFGKVLSLDGTNDYVSASLTNTIPNESDFTIEFFFKTCGSGYQSFFDNRGSTAGNGVSVMVAQDVAPQISVSMRNDLGTDVSLNVNTIEKFVNNAFGIHHWIHFAFVHKHSDNSNKIFIDGALAATSINDVNPVSSNLYLGTFDHNTTEAMAKGYIDELRISSSAQYSTNFSVPNSSFTPDVSTLGLWHFEEAFNATSFADAALTGGVALTAHNYAHTFFTQITPLNPIITQGQSLQLFAGSPKAISFLWYPNQEIDNVNSNSPTVEPSSTRRYSVMVKDTNTCIMYDSVLVTVSPLSVISQLHSSSFKTYPNPSKGVITLEFGMYISEPLTATIVDVNGKEIWRKKVLGEQEIISTENFKPGVYQFMIVQEGESISKTLVIQ